jgi:hypothetical protein
VHFRRSLDSPRNCRSTVTAICRCRARREQWTFGKRSSISIAPATVLDRVEESLAGGHREEHMGFWGVGLMVGGFIPGTHFRRFRSSSHTPARSQ